MTRVRHKKGYDIMKKEEMKTAYGTPSDEFRHSVMNTLYHLDDNKTAKYTSRKRAIKVILVCAVIAVAGTTTVAAATNFFGLFSKPVGQYGVAISTSSIAPEDNTEDQEQDFIAPVSHDYIVRMGYTPEGFVPFESNGYTNAYLNGNQYSDSWFFMSFAYEADSYSRTEKSVINSEETEFNGHQALIVTKKSSENNDHITYIVTERFEEENIVLRCEFDGRAYNGSYFEPDRDEMLRIMEGITLEKSDDKANSSRQSTYEKGPLSDVYPSDLIEAGKSSFGEIGKAYTEMTANYYDEAEKALTFKVISVTEQKNAGDFKKADFSSAGEGISLYDKYFDEDGNLKSDQTVTVIDQHGDGVSSLTKTHEETIHRHFYRVQVEVTADQDIDPLYTVYKLYPFAMDNDDQLYYERNGNTIELIGTSLSDEDPFKLEKEKTLVISYAVIADEEVLPDFCVGVMTGNGLTDEAELRIFRITE